MLHLPANRIKNDLNPDKILKQLYELFDKIVIKINMKILIKFTVDHLYIPDNLEIKEAEIL